MKKKERKKERRTKEFNKRLEKMNDEEIFPSLRSIARLAKRRPSFTELTSRNTEEKGEEKKRKEKKKKEQLQSLGGKWHA